MCRYKILALLLCVGSLVHCGGDEDKTSLDITITAHPAGGAFITTLTCVFEGELVGGTTPITARIEWWVEDFMHENDTLYTDSSHEFSSEDPEEVTASITAPAGYIFYDYWWVKIKWTDADGTENSVESSRAFCHE